MKSETMMMMEEVAGVSYGPTEVRRLAARGAALLRDRLGSLKSGEFVVNAVNQGLALHLWTLSIWLLGAAVAVLDLEDPRLNESLKDLSWPRALVAYEKGNVEAELIFEGGGGLREEVSWSWPPFKKEDVASHCFFTSGTTGRPKGCVCSRSALRAYALGRNAVDGVTAQSRILCLSSATFDPTIGDLAQCGYAGATLIVVAGKISELPQLLVKRARPTHITTTPALWQLIVAEVPDSLEVVSLGGEALPASLALLGPTLPYSLKCVYGVTECCVYQSSSPPLRRGIEDVGFVGFALPGVTIYLENGEVILKGEQVRGCRYLLEDNNTSFFSNDDGELCYRTGDLGRWSDSDGLRILGRVAEGDQVKLRGIRVALSDVEALILSAAASVVESCKALVVESNHNKSLVALLRFHDHDNHGEYVIIEGVLRRCLDALLLVRAPAHLRPAHWIELCGNKWPTTKNGKTDRRAMATICQDLILKKNSTSSVSSTMTNTEVAISKCWRELLLHENKGVSAADDFVALGGDSLVALRCARRLEAWLRGNDFAEREAGFGDAPLEVFPPAAMLRLRTCRNYAHFVTDVFKNDQRFTPPPHEEEETIIAAPQENEAPPPLDDDDDDDDLFFRHLSINDDDDDVNDDDAVVEKALGDAAEANLSAMVAALLQVRRPSEGRQKKRRVSPLSRAAAGSATECLRLLLERDPSSLRSVDARQRGPLSVAASRGHAGCCELLLKAGAPLSARDHAKQTAFHACARSGDAQTMAVLLGASRLTIDARDRWGRTPLAWLALRSKDQPETACAIAALLLEAGADPDPPSIPGKSTSLIAETPLEIARRLTPPDGGPFARLLLARQQ